MNAEPAKVNAKELSGHSSEELRNLERSLREDLFKFRMQRYTNQLTNTMEIRRVRRSLARVLTILSSREKNGEAPQAARGPSTDQGEGPRGKAAAAEAPAAPAKKKATPAKRTKKTLAEAQE